jgi:hypothetical protein
MLLADFIETPGQNCSVEDLGIGVAEVITTLNENSAQIVSIITACYSPASYILSDLAKKMELQNCIQQFAILYDKHIDELVSLCVWSWHDLKRFIDNQPSYLEKIMDTINKNEIYVQRLLNDASNAEDIINYIKELDPDYEFGDQFADLAPSSRACKR